MWTVEHPVAEDKLCPPLILTAEETDGSASTIVTPSVSNSAESSTLKEHEGPQGVDTESLSGAQRVKNVSSSNREYSELSVVLLLDLCAAGGCALGLADVLVSGSRRFTATLLLESSDIMGVDWGSADWAGEGRRREVHSDLHLTRVMGLNEQQNTGWKICLFVSLSFRSD